jgi:predicted GNAT superfamily acetyltransferase
MFEKLLALNNAHALELSFATEEQFQKLLSQAAFVRAGVDGLCLLVGFNEGSSYDNPNFRWLKERFQSFNYIDRVVVAKDARGRGLARALYEAFEADARTAGRSHLVCEINAVPPNPVSDKLHRSLGFEPVGEQVLEGTGKTVRYWAKTLA